MRLLPSARAVAPAARALPWWRWRVRLGIPVACAVAWLAAPTPGSLVLGGAIALLGLLLRGLAAGTLHKHETLTTSGPYAITRNPLYLGSALLAGGLLVAAHSWVAALLGIAYLAVFYPIAIRQEETKLRARYGAAFDAYAARVPRFLPRRLSAGTTRFRPSLALYRRNREYQAALGLLIALVFLWTKSAGLTADLVDATRRALGWPVDGMQQSDARPL